MDWSLKTGVKKKKKIKTNWWSSGCRRPIFLFEMDRIVLTDKVNTVGISNEADWNLDGFL